MSLLSPYPAHLGSIDFDGTADGNGIVWDYETLDGWFEAPDVLSSESDTFPDGVVVTAARNRGRAIVINGAAVMPTDNRALWYTAVDTLNAQCDLLLSAGLLQVDEPIPKQAYVRRTGAIKTARIGELHALTFQIPLKAADPRKYAQTALQATRTLTGTATLVSSTFTNVGTTNAPFTATITGPAVRPFIRDLTTTGHPYVAWAATLSGGDTLVMDFANRTITKNGVQAYQYIDPGSNWFYFRTGNTNLQFGRTSGASTSVATIDYRPAYI